MSTQQESEVRKAVTSTFVTLYHAEVINALACLLAQNTDFINENNEFKKTKNYPQQTQIV